MTVASRRIPPGPAERYGNAEELLVWMTRHFDQYGDVYKASIYGSDVYVITSTPLVERVLVKNWQNYIRKGYAIKRISMLLGNGLISSNGDFWVNQRRMMQPAFTRKAVAAQTDVMISANAALLEEWKSAARRNVQVNVTKDLSRMVLRVILVSLFGDDYPTISPYFDIVSENSRDLEFAQMFTSLGKVIIELITARRRTPRGGADILSTLMQTRDRAGHAMPDVQMAREIMTLIVAGHETTSSVLNWAWYLLSQDASVEAKLAEELERLHVVDFPTMENLEHYAYTRRVIDEVLRLYPPLWLMTRRALEDDQLGDYHVPAGTNIYISPFFLQRHPALWEKPDRFDPDRAGLEDSATRPGLALCPFGAGPRKCIGDLFARVEIQIHLMMIARELRLRYAAPPGVSTQPAMVGGMNLLSKDDLFMTPELKERSG